MTDNFALGNFTVENFLEASMKTSAINIGKVVQSKHNRVKEKYLMKYNNLLINQYTIQSIWPFIEEENLLNFSGAILPITR